MFGCSCLLSACRCESPSSDAEPAALSSTVSAPVEKSPELEPAAQLLAKGSEAPNFDAIAHTGARIRLSQFLDKPVLVLFYDADGSAASAPIFAALKAQWLNLRPHLSMVLAVAPQHAVEHAAYGVAQELPFLLIADVDRRIAAAYGVPHAKQPVVGFLVDAQLRITEVMLSPQPDALLARITAPTQPK